MTQPASLPYAGTSGWSGSDASRERAERADSSGRTSRVQHEIEAYARLAGPRGITISTLRNTMEGLHHGILSGALTAIHKDGRVLRLTEKRDGCSVYVAPQFLLGREAVPPKRKPRVQTVVLEENMEPEFVGHLVFAALNSADEVKVRLLVRTDG